MKQNQKQRSEGDRGRKKEVRCSRIEKKIMNDRNEFKFKKMLEILITRKID